MSALGLGVPLVPIFPCSFVVCQQLYPEAACGSSVVPDEWDSQPGCFGTAEECPHKVFRGLCGDPSAAFLGMLLGHCSVLKRVMGTGVFFNHRTLQYVKHRPDADQTHRRVPSEC